MNQLRKHNIAVAPSLKAKRKKQTKKGAKKIKVWTLPPPPHSKIPGSAPVYLTWLLLLLLLIIIIIIINLLYLRKFIYSSKSFEPIIIKNISVYKIIVYYVWIVVWWKQRQKHHCLPNIKPANQSALCQDTSGGLVRSHIDENGTLRLFRYFF